ncbi:Uncharacterised protein [Shigella sonnei]|nr:Uncharacterised protein [Shigella sonnei]
MHHHHGWRFAAHFCGFHQITPYLAVTIWRRIHDVLSNNLRVGKLYLSRQRIIWLEQIKQR